MIDIALSLASRFAPNLVRRLAGEKAGDVAERLLSLGRTITGVQSPDEIEAAKRIAECLRIEHLLSS